MLAVPLISARSFNLPLKRTTVGHGFRIFKSLGYIFFKFVDCNPC